VTDVVTIPVAGQGYGYMETEIIHNYEFLDAITSGKTPEPNFHDGWKACQVTDAVIQSAGTKSWVGIPA
jgi:hypothetical protein